MKYKLGNPHGMTMNQIIDLGNNEHFSKLTCSIIPTVDYWKNPENKILTKLMNEKCDICFEYPVSSIPFATASYTDVMLISDNIAIAVESKWTEPIGALCNRQKAKRKDQVQSHWINIINEYLEKKFTLEQFKEIEYQLLHRVASACSLKKEKCIVVYQIFYTDEPKEDFKNEILKIIELLSDDRIEFYIHFVKIIPNQKYKELEDKIKSLSSKKEIIQEIKYTISYNQLFDFKQDDIQKV